MIVAFYFLIVSFLLIKFHTQRRGDGEDDIEDRVIEGAADEFIARNMVLPFMYDIFEVLVLQGKEYILWGMICCMFFALMALSLLLNIVADAAYFEFVGVSSLWILTYIVNYIVIEGITLTLLCCCRIFVSCIALGMNIIKAKRTLKREGFNDREIRQKIIENEFDIEKLAETKPEPKKPIDPKTQKRLDEIRAKVREEHGRDAIDESKFPKTIE